ncbi:MAG: PsiF family protein [Usitatibacter sp.]
MNTKFTCITACAAAWGALALGAYAAEGDKPQTQQSRFATCAHASKGLKGDAHQDFMSECLMGHEEEAEELKREAPHRASADGSFQQGKMKICNDEAGKKNLHGDERRAFMSSCLKG